MVLEVDNNRTNSTCPLCNSESIKLKYEKLHYQKEVLFSTNTINLSKAPAVWQCDECLSKFTQNTIPETEAIKLYTEGNSAQRWTIKSFKDEKTEDVIAILDQYFKPGLTLLDIGCATGNLLDYGKAHGCSTYGVEYSTTAVETSRSKGHTVYTDITQVTEKFDVITAFDLVEHLYDIPTFFKTTISFLKEGGYLILFTGDPDCKTAGITKSKWWYFNFPEHVVFPSQSFFKNKLPSFILKKYHATYNGKIYVSPNVIKFLKTLVAYFLKDGKYTGLPSFGPDHGLIILQKKS